MAVGIVGESRVPVIAERASPAPAHHAHANEPSESAATAVTAATAATAAGSDGHASLSRSTTVVTSLVAGASAGALAKTAIAPLDRTKINFQISKTPYSWRGALAFLVASARSEGVAALWRGNSATMARIVPYAAIQFTAHEQCKKALGVDSPARARAAPVRHMLAGSLAGVISQSATYPLDLARARMAVTSARQLRTLAAVFRHVAHQQGLKALYRGYGATVMGVIPYAGVSFFTYDSLKHLYLDVMGGAPSPMGNMAMGGAAGALAQTASYPLDIVRRRMQTAQRGEYTTIRTTLVLIYSTEGWRGFYKGLSMNWVKGPVAVGISFATYDTIRTMLRDLAVKLER